MGSQHVLFLWLHVAVHVLVAASVSSMEAEIVNLKTLGSVRGYVADLNGTKTRVFRGIPYAKASVVCFHDSLHF